MAEAVRLVVWDLDETFWKGTLTEGGISYDQAAHDTVIELAKRGIMSSICSKNDLEPVKRILEERGLWDYFIFPSINWEPKGPRIAQMIEDIQLRPETVMFIDDNHLNLKEAQHFTPALQVANEEFVPRILASPLFKGKDDGKLSRLNQYKLLEKRKADEAEAAGKAGGSNVEFLRGCGIRVRIEHDIEANIDRAVELINRTNQLNFTKLRLPEDPAAAREELRRQLDHHLVQAGLIEVFDRYGNYGFCGFYMVRAASDQSKLMHFCFSCRILNMGVEAWMYQHLGRPALGVRGHVLSDPVVAAPVDWITPVAAGAANDQAASGPRFGAVAARGGCVLMPLMHYFRMNTDTVVGEFNITRDGLPIRLDHSQMFRLAIEGVPEEAMETLALLGYKAEDFRTDFFRHAGKGAVYIFSNWTDLGCPLYRHKATGVVVPYKLLPAARRLTPEQERAAFYINEFFERAGMLDEKGVKDNLRLVLNRIPREERIFVLLSVDRMTLPDGTEKLIPTRVHTNSWTTEVASQYPNVTTLRMADFVRDEGDIKEGSALGHFDRKVYHRIYETIVELASQGTARRPAASA